MYNLLICDDERDIRNALKIYLSGEGYKIFEAENGEEALETLDREPGIGVALLDLMLPGIDGFEVCRRIRAKTVK